MYKEVSVLKRDSQGAALVFLTSYNQKTIFADAVLSSG